MLYFIRLGSHKLNSGEKMKINIHTISTIKKGAAPMMISSSDISGTTLFIIYKLSPTGGEITAISMLTASMIPYHNGSNPIDNIAGSKIGVVITIIEIPSMNIPSTISRSIKRITTPIGGKGIDKENLAKFSGTLSTFKKFPKHKADATMTQIETVA